MTEQQLNELSIFALRELARRTGVYAPTSKKKSELIREIIDISEGKKQPYIAKTKQGRPPKDVGYSFADIFMPKTHIDFAQESRPYYTFNSKETDASNADMKTLSGYVELLNNNTAFLWNGKQGDYTRYFISENLVKEYELRTGDKLVAEVCSEENQMIVKTVFNINDVPVAKYKRIKKNYYEIEHVEPKQSLVFDQEKFNKFDIKLGESVYLYGSNNKENTRSIIDLINSSQIQKKIYINVSIAEKNKYLLQNLKNTELFVASITAEMDIVKRLIIIAIERAKHLLERGENVLIAIDDVLSLSGIDSLDLDLTKKLLSLTKCGKNAGSITLFAIMPADRNIRLFEKLVDKRIKIVDNDLFLM